MARPAWVPALVRRWRHRARRFSTMLLQEYRTAGSVGAGRLTLRLMLELLARPVWLAREYVLDRRLGIETRREAAIAAESAGAAVHRDSVEYQATPVRAVRRLLDSLPIDDPGEYTFVDLGCGKGRVLVLAAMHGFGRVIGVELDRKLISVAEANVRSFQERTRSTTPQIELVLADAAQFRFAPDPTVVYLHNPFGEDTLRDVVENLRASAATAAHPLVVAYYNPVHGRVLEELFPRRQPSSKEVPWAVYVGETAPSPSAPRAHREP